MSNSHRNGRVHNAKKRPRKNIDSLTELLTKKWKEDKEEREEKEAIEQTKAALREQKEDERVEREEKRQDEMVAAMKMAAEAISRIAEGR